MHKYLILAGMLAASVIPCRADGLFVLIPGADQSGPAGSTLAWELQTTNPDPTLYLQITGVTAASFDNTQGSDDSFASFTYPAVSPSTTEIDPFYSLTWAPAATVGYGFSGDFTITASYCLDDQEDGCGSSFDTEVAYSASVSASEPSEVPEPGTLVLLGLGLLALCRKVTDKTALSV